MQGETVGAQQLGGFDAFVQRVAAQRGGGLALIEVAQQMCLQRQKPRVIRPARPDVGQACERRVMAASLQFDVGDAQIRFERVGLSAHGRLRLAQGLIVTPELLEQGGVVTVELGIARLLAQQPLEFGDAGIRFAEPRTHQCEIGAPLPERGIQVYGLLEAAATLLELVRFQQQISQAEPAQHRGLVQCHRAPRGRHGGAAIDILAIQLGVAQQVERRGIG